MSFVLSGLPVSRFAPLFGLPEADLAAQGVLRETVTEPQAAPCRITLCDAAPGETVLLLNFEHQPAATPYRSSHAIYVREAAKRTYQGADEIPDALRRRTLSLRAFDAAGMMVDADICEGAEAATLTERLLSAQGARYIHAHTARRGCFLARIDPA